MSSQESSTNTDLVSKVSFFPVSDSTGENKALIVTIKKVVPEGDEKLKAMEAAKHVAKPPSETPRISLTVPPTGNSSKTPTREEVKETRRRARASRSSSERSNKATSTETRKGVSQETQTSVETPAPDIASEGHSHSSPCIRHAAQNFSAKATSLTSEKTSLCSNCSKSVLSYIFLVQDFLDSVTKEIVGDSNTDKCMQCLREESRIAFTNEMPSAASIEATKAWKTREKTKTTHSKEAPRSVRKYEETAETLVQRSISQHRQDADRPGSQHEMEGHIPHHYQPPASSHEVPQSYDTTPQPQYQEDIPFRKPAERQQPNFTDTASDQQRNGDIFSQQLASEEDSTETSQGTTSSHPLTKDNSHELNVAGESNQHKDGGSTNQYEDDSLRQYQSNDSLCRQEYGPGPQYRHGEGSGPAETVSSPLISEGMDGIVSTLSSMEREVYDSARNVAGWDSLSEPQERLVSWSSNSIPSQAYVTMCRNNAEALGCLVVGTSLLLSRTTRTLCVLVADAVSNAFRRSLSSVFHVVQLVRSMDSLGTTKLSLLEQPELGISFEKLHVWRLVQFNKCVFLNPDTLVIKNCDELFSHEELSAVADIGWPDCFNSGVFVFVPSVSTFWKLIEHAEKRGSYDGGDQGLLNSYFDSWGGDIGRKLSFIYNLMANVSYTYTPAFKQFGRNVKIVQFYGSFKPWHVTFFSRTGQIAPSSAVHPTYVQFVHIWINIFRISCLRQLSREIQSYVQKNETVCAVDLLRFFPLPTESEAEFFLTPPSVRVRLEVKKLRRSMQGTLTTSPKSEEPVPTLEDEVDTAASQQSSEGKGGAPPAAETTGTSDETEATAAAAEDTASEKKKSENELPGSEIGDYQGMRAWEQGRMDYQGTDSSETIIRRLEFLMHQPK